MKNFNIKTKILLGFGIGVFALFLIGMFSLFSNENNKQTYK